MVHANQGAMTGNVMEINSYGVYSKASSIQLALIETGGIVRTWL